MCATGPAWRRRADERGAVPGLGLAITTCPRQWSAEPRPSSSSVAGWPASGSPSSRAPRGTCGPPTRAGYRRPSAGHQALGRSRVTTHSAAEPGSIGSLLHPPRRRLRSDPRRTTLRMEIQLPSRGRDQPDPRPQSCSLRCRKRHANVRCSPRAPATGWREALTSHPDSAVPAFHTWAHISAHRMSSRPPLAGVRNGASGRTPRPDWGSTDRPLWRRPDLGKVTAHTSTRRGEVAAGWQTFVAVSGSPFWLPARPVLPDLKCARLGHAAPAERRADCPSCDSLVNRCAGIRIDCCRMAASEWLIGAVALQT
jgi:hypothetical protein